MELIKSEVTSAEFDTLLEEYRKAEEMFLVSNCDIADGNGCEEVYEINRKATDDIHRLDQILKHAKILFPDDADKTIFSYASKSVTYRLTYSEGPIFFTSQNSRCANDWNYFQNGNIFPKILGKPIGYIATYKCGVDAQYTLEIINIVN